MQTHFPLLWAAAKTEHQTGGQLLPGAGSKDIFTAAVLLHPHPASLTAERTLSPQKSHHAAALARAYILVCHFPVRSLAVGHHLPHHDAVAPDIAGRREFPEGDCLRCRPSDGDLPSLERKENK